MKKIRKINKLISVMLVAFITIGNIIPVNAASLTTNSIFSEELTEKITQQETNENETIIKDTGKTPQNKAESTSSANKTATVSNKLNTPTTPNMVSYAAVNALNTAAAVAVEIAPHINMPPPEYNETDSRPSGDYVITYYDEYKNKISKAGYAKGEKVELLELFQMDDYTTYWADENGSRVADNFLITRDMSLYEVTKPDTIVTFMYLDDDGFYSKITSTTIKDGEEIPFPYLNGSYKWEEAHSDEEMISYRQVKESPIILPSTVKIVGDNYVKTLTKGESETNIDFEKDAVIYIPSSVLPEIDYTEDAVIDNTTSDVEELTPVPSEDTEPIIEIPVENTVEPTISPEETGENYQVETGSYTPEVNYYINAPQEEVVTRWFIGLDSNTVIAYLTVSGVLYISSQHYSFTGDPLPTAYVANFDASNMWGCNTEYASQIKSVYIADNVQITSMQNWFKGTALEEAPDLSNQTGLLSIEGAFEGTNITTIPKLPNSIENMDFAFKNCTNLTSGLPEAFPANLVSANSTFSGCKKLTGSIPTFPNSLTNMYETFYKCEKLTGTIPTLPSAVTNMYYSFGYCSGLTGSIPDLPNTITNLDGTFCYCPGLTGKIPELPSSVTSLKSTFYQCARLTGTIPTLPNSLVKNGLDSTFNNCDKLTGSIPEIPDGITSLFSSFSGCRELTGTIPTLPSTISNLYNAFNGCKKLTGSIPELPNTITDMRNAFRGCIGLTGTVSNIPTNLKTAAYAFSDSGISGVIPDFHQRDDIAVDISYMFNNCDNITSIGKLPIKVSNFRATFYDCDKLTTLTNLPSECKDFWDTFAECDNLIGNLPAFPTTVTGYSYGGFLNCKNLNGTIGTLPTSMTSMDKMFSGCVKLKGPIPTLPADLESAASAFENCKVLTGAFPKLPNSLKNMRAMYYNCATLSNDDVPEISANMPNLPTNVEDLSYAFYNCTGFKLIPAYPGFYSYNTGKSYFPKLPNTLTNMEYAFYNCPNLYCYIPEIPSSVTNMEGTFYNCVNLYSEITIPENVTKLRYTYYNCKNLYGQIPTLPSRVTDLSYTFYCCENLDRGIPAIPSGVTDLDYTFYECSSLSGNIPTLPDSIITMESAFEGCSGLKGIISNIPSNVKNMHSTFDWCTGLTGSIPSIPNSVTNMEETFFYCNKLTGTIPNLPSSCTNMSQTFYNCTGLTGEIPTLPSSVTSLKSTFYNCSGLTGTIPTLPSAVTNMYSTFSGCKNLTGSIPEIPNTVTDLGSTFSDCLSLTGNIPELPSDTKSLSYTFKNCSGLTGSVPALPTKATNLTNTFYNCTGLTGSIPELPSTITNLSSTFYNCSGLTGDIPAIPSKVYSMVQTFYECRNLSGKVLIPSSTDTMKEAFKNTNISEIVFSAKTKNTSSKKVTISLLDAFTGCDNLTKITIQSINYSDEQKLQAEAAGLPSGYAGLHNWDGKGTLDAETTAKSLAEAFKPTEGKVIPTTLYVDDMWIKQSDWAGNGRPINAIYTAVVPTNIELDEKTAETDFEIKLKEMYSPVSAVRISIPETEFYMYDESGRKSKAVGKISFDGYEFIGRENTNPTYTADNPYVIEGSITKPEGLTAGKWSGEISINFAVTNE